MGKVMKLIEVDQDYSDDNLFDEEIIDIFVEESAEVIDEISENFPLWKADYDDRAALEEIRRAYHTLKGSANMVRARVVAELASAVEDVLNKIVDGTTPPDGAVVKLVNDSMESIPSMVEFFKQNRSERRTANIVKQIELAQSILSGEHINVKPLESSSSTIMRQDDELITNIPLADSLIVMDAGLDNKPVINKVKSDDMAATGATTIGFGDGVKANPNAKPSVDLAKFEQLDRKVNGHQLVIEKLEAQISQAQQQLKMVSKQFQQSDQGQDQFSSKKEVEAVNAQFVSLAKEVKDLKYFMSGSSSQILQEVSHENEKQLKKVSSVLKKAQQRNDEMDKVISKAQRKQLIGMVIAGVVGLMSGLGGAYVLFSTLS